MKKKREREFTPDGFQPISWEWLEQCGWMDDGEDSMCIWHMEPDMEEDFVGQLLRVVFVDEGKWAVEMRYGDQSPQDGVMVSNQIKIRAHLRNLCSLIGIDPMYTGYWGGE